MIIHSPIFSGSITQDANHAYANLSGSFVGEFTGSTDFTRIANKPALVSGSQQVIDLLPTGVVSGSTQLTTEFDARYLNTSGDGIVSGSQQIKDLLPAGTVSGSSQITITESQISDLVHYTDTDFDNRLATKSTSDVSEGANLYYTDTRVKTKLTADGVISGSVQVLGGTGIVSGSSQVTPLLPTGVISGSSQVLGGSGLVSGSSQIDVTATTNYSTISSHISSTNNPHSVTATQVGLGNVTNESKATMFSSPTFTGTVSGVSATHVGLGNVTNESKSTMFTSPTFTGTPIAPTAASNTNSTQIATTAYVQQELTDLIGGANEAFDTLLEISASLASGDSTLNTLVDGKLAKASNLSDLTDASAARTNLGLAIGTNVQAFNSTLVSVAGGTYSGDDSITTIGTVTAGSVTAILPLGVISGSAQILGGSGLVSGSSQITAGSTTGFATAVKTQLDANTVVSGSSQINVASTTGDIALGSRTSGNYVASLVAGTNITLSNNTGEGATPTIGLTNNTISGIALGSNLATLTIGTGLSGTSYNGSGAVTIANTGVTSNVAGTGISVSGATGAVTISIGQSVATSANAQFNSLGIGMAASATAGRIDATNDIVAFSSSDIRFKENVTPIENALDKINQIGGYTYDWKEENKIEHGYEGNDVGVIAQEIESVLPQLVQTRENGFKAVKYDKLVALLIEGIKEQQKQIDELKLQTCNCNK